MKSLKNNKLTGLGYRRRRSDLNTPLRVYLTLKDGLKIFQDALLERLHRKKLSLTRKRPSSMVTKRMNYKVIALFTLLFWGVGFSQLSEAPVVDADTFPNLHGKVEEATHSYLVKYMKGATAPKILRLSKLIVKLSKQNGFPVGLVLSVMRVESGFQSWAISSKGAVGLMQVMPETGEWLAARAGMRWEGPTMLLDEETNVKLGIQYLKFLKQKYQGDLKKVLSAYNQGPAKVDEDMLAGKAMNLGYHDKVRNYFPKIAYGDRLW